MKQHEKEEEMIVFLNFNIIFLKRSQIQSGGFTNLLCKSVKCLERIKSALQRKRSGILLSPATNLLSVRFHIVDKYLHGLII